MYSAAVVHRLGDLGVIRDWCVPKIMVFHNLFKSEAHFSNQDIDKEGYLESVRALIDSCYDEVELVFISELKKSDWDLRRGGTVILPGIDTSEFGPHRGDQPTILRVGNELVERSVMTGYNVQCRIATGFPSTILGKNPTIPFSRPAKDFDELKAAYRSHRLYLNTTVDGWEDGYNLSMLEAMATGMTVVSTQNATSPIVDGENGFISDDVEYLRDRIGELLADQELACRMGEKARQTVESQFSTDRFARNWHDVIDKVSSRSRERRLSALAQTAEETPTPRAKILISYVANPTTTGSYIERALRETHEVISLGPTIREEFLHQWNMRMVVDLVKPHDVAIDETSPLAKALPALPEGWEPDLFLWIESGVNYLPLDIGLLSCPKAAYLIDNHLNLHRHLSWAKKFDVVFVAQRAYVEKFQAAGCPYVYWLPLAADPEVHGKMPEPCQYDIGFVGSMGTGIFQRRGNLITRLQSAFDFHAERAFLQDMTRVFCRSKIVFNNAIRYDLNMRVFEALCSGSLLLTDDAEGLDDLFEDGVHYVKYSDENLEEKVQYYLTHDSEREGIAEIGRREVLARHTYQHRVEALVHNVLARWPENQAAEARRLSRLLAHHPPDRDEKVVVVSSCATPFLRALAESAGFELVRTGEVQARTWDSSQRRRFVILDPSFPWDTRLEALTDLPGSCAYVSAPVNHRAETLVRLAEGRCNSAESARRSAEETFQTLRDQDFVLEELTLPGEEARCFGRTKLIGGSPPWVKEEKWVKVLPRS